MLRDMLKGRMSRFTSRGFAGDKTGQDDNRNGRDDGNRIGESLLCIAFVLKLYTSGFDFEARAGKDWDDTLVSSQVCFFFHNRLAM